MGGSTVVVAVTKRCPSESGSIAWLPLSATSERESGMFERTRYIQRINTTGGVAPTGAGYVGEERSSLPRSGSRKAALVEQQGRLAAPKLVALQFARAAFTESPVVPSLTRS